MNKCLFNISFKRRAEDSFVDTNPSGKFKNKGEFLGRKNNFVKSVVNN